MAAPSPCWPGLIRFWSCPDPVLDLLISVPELLVSVPEWSSPGGETRSPIARATELAGGIEWISARATELASGVEWIWARSTELASGVEWIWPRDQ
jgi:hypothetical protein